MAVFDAIFLGNTAIVLDPTEGSGSGLLGISDDDSENYLQLVGNTYGSTADPLLSHIVSITTTDLGGASGALDTDNNAGTGSSDTITYDIGAGSETNVFDGLGAYNATITYFDGTTAAVSAVVIQDTSGNLFLAPAVSGGAQYLDGPIRSLTLNSGISSNGDLAENRVVSNFVTCFTPGTMIDTPDGLRDVAVLSVGDLINTVDNGPQVLRWIGRIKVDARQSAAFKPVRIAAGALGGDVPETDLVVSQQHRVLVRSAIAQRMFGTYEVLVAAKHLTSLPGIEIAEDFCEVTYLHLLFDRHELVMSNGAVTESLFTGPQALKSVPELARCEILTLFPELAQIGADAEEPVPARHLVPGRRSRRLVERHVANGKDVLELT